MAAGIGRAIQRGALFLRCDNPFDCRGDRNGFCGNQSGEGAFALLSSMACSRHFLLIGILVVACSRQLMQNQPSSMLSRVVVGLTAVAMFGAAIAMFVL